MISFDSCEEYVLNELAELKEKVNTLTEARDLAEWRESRMMEYLGKLEPLFTLRRGIEGKKLIEMKYVFEEYDPEAFKMLTELFDLKIKEDS